MQNKFEQPLHLLLDGADKLGKSTVIQLLSRKLDLPIIKMPESKEFIQDGSIEKMSKFFNTITSQFSEFDFLMDRGYTSSLVYSKIFNRDIDLSYIKNIENILKPKIFILTNSEPLDEEEIPAIQKEWNRINDEFYDMAARYNYQIIKVGDKTPIEICNIILEKIS